MYKYWQSAVNEDEQFLYVVWYGGHAMAWMVQGLNVGMLKGFFFSPKCPYRLWVPPAPCSMGTEILFLGVKWLGCEVNQSSPFSAYVKNEWSYTSTQSVCLEAWTRTPLLS
jgi:hypothetical protein